MFAASKMQINRYDARNYRAEWRKPRRKDDHNTDRMDLAQTDSLIADLPLVAAGEYVIVVDTFSGVAQGSIEVLLTTTAMSAADPGAEHERWAGQRNHRRDGGAGRCVFLRNRRDCRGNHHDYGGRHQRFRSTGHLERQ
ncbi:MAG: hypothetical protein IPK17_18205 [Chloroflexi bacterium]|uniref:hypothetical protein n=1 Tax=Candidatus Flexifilum breve TaxID=3140694 RepID=UPI003136FB67|nr:hypothetical protein [Chloroflexota bacterium]